MSEELELGIEQFNAGNKEEARKIFLKIIKEHPNYTDAYMWLYKLAYNDNERMNILKRVLSINPIHEEALNLYRQLSVKEKPQPSRIKQPSQIKNPPAPVKKNNTLTIGIAAAIVIAICCFCGALALNTPSGTTSPFISGYQVKYVISGNANSAFITYFNETGGTEQIEANLPWQKEMNVDAGAALSLVAQNNGTGTITCEIWVNGEKKKTSTSTAQYGVVTCSDFVY